MHVCAEKNETRADVRKIDRRRLICACDIRM